MSKAGVRKFATIARLVLFVAGVGAWFTGCGGSASGSSTSTSTQSGGSGGSTSSSGANVQTITVESGPAAAAGSPSTDSAFTSVTVCVPGSTTQCQTISGILVDTGSSGLRVLASALTLSLPQQKDGSGNPIVECAQFVDSETWGPVQTADIQISGETAGGAAIQVVGSPSFSTVPTSCSSLGPLEDDLASLGANGILGVGNFVQDCGPGCALSGAANLGFYFACPAGGCPVTSSPTALPTAQQVVNPVALFATDNNGVIVELPAVSGPEASVTGTMIFGIGTQSNNGLGSATVLTVDPNIGNFTTTFNGQTFRDAAFLDTGSNAIDFATSAITGMATCKDFTFFYCPGSTQNFTATNLGVNGASSSVNFSIGNADTLLANPNDFVAPDLGGPNPGTFDWGLPFFFGRNVYTAIEGKSTPGGTGPFVAY
jgi:hypothetical protein